MGSICNTNKSDLVNESMIPIESVPQEAKITEFIQNEDLSRIYQIDQHPLGINNYGSIRKATMKSEHDQFYRFDNQLIIKTVYKNKINSIQQFKQQVETIMSTNHPNLIKFYESYEDQNNIYIVEQFCNGKNLLDEKELAGYMYKMMNAVFYLHQVGICHEYLSPQSFFLHNQDGNTEIKLADFALEKKLCKSKSDLANTPYFIAPEVLKGQRQDPSCDIWSLGEGNFPLEDLIIKTFITIFLKGNEPLKVKTETLPLTKLKIQLRKCQLKCLRREQRQKKRFSINDLQLLLPEKHPFNLKLYRICISFQSLRIHIQNQPALLQKPLV